MKRVKNPFGKEFTDMEFPDSINIVSMAPIPVVENPEEKIKEALEHPIGTKSLAEIALEKKRKKRNAVCTILVSDNTRPVPYKGKQGILLPAVDILLKCGYRPEEILILIATGTHRSMEKEEIEAMLDKRITEYGIRVENHISTDDAMHRNIGATRRGTPILLDTRYLDADLKIATGLVESHFMAGASGGRKSICPGIIAKKSTFIFHGPEFMAHENATDLVLEGNPVHEESLEIARRATMDFCMNVTVDYAFRVTGFFFGDMEKAHFAAVDFLKKSVTVPVPKKMDVVITHAGFVGINHYQTCKGAAAAKRILKDKGYMIIIADTTSESEVIGSQEYRVQLSLMKLIGGKAYTKMICSPDWTFLPDQWQVQQWAKIFEMIPMDHFIMYAPKIDKVWWPGLPGINGQDIMKEGGELSPDCYAKFISEVFEYVEEKSGKSIKEMDVAYLEEGPYAVPYVKNENAE